MRILKKLVRKLYHLIWFLSLFIIFISPVHAVDGYIPSSIYSSDISASAQAQWYNTSHTSITTNAITDVGYMPYFRASPGTTSYLSFNVYTNLQPGYVYSITVYLNNGYNVASWNNLVATGTYLGGANSNNQNNTCRADVYSFVDTWNIKYNIISNTDGNSSTSTGAYYITFSPSCAGSYLNIAVAFENASSYAYFYGYHLDVLGDANSLTSSQVQNIISNSGLATANSVQEVQRGVNQVQQQLSGVQDSVDDVNDTLKDDTAPSNTDLSDVNVISDTPISDLVTLPLSLLNSIYNGISGTCSSWHLLLPFNYSIYIPCFTISDYVGEPTANLIDFAICLFMAYKIVLLFISIFDDITTLSDTYTNWVKRGRY